MSNAKRELWISLTSGIVLTMTIIGIVGWNGGHPSVYYWATIAILVLVCVLGSKKFRPVRHN
jgi:hypothetical protein